MKVFCYRNLNRKGVVWSVKLAKSNLVIDRTPTVFISHAIFVVSAAGRKRVLLHKRKNVHAGVRGDRLKGSPRNVEWKKARYNPYEHKTFVLEDGTPIYGARYARLNKLGLWVGEVLSPIL
jgi:hypothetical protein